MEHDARRPEPSGTALWPIATLVTTFVVSRVLAIKCGTSFDVSTIGTFMQFLDPQLLLRDPLRSVWLLHSQPPLFNLYLALGLAFGPDGALPFFAATYLGAGLLLALGLWGLLRAVGLRAWTASVLASVFVVSPTSLLLENWLYTTYPVMALLVLAALCLHVALLRAHAGLIFSFFALLCAVVLTRSAFHVLWLAGCVLLVLRTKVFAARKVVALAALPLGLAIAPYVKNYLLFDVASSSSWLGMSVARVVTMKVPSEERAQMVKAGELSELALARPFSPLSHYPRKFVTETVAHTRHPALDAPHQSTGAPNYNHIAYVGIAKQSMRDAKIALLEHPEAALRGMGIAWRIFLKSPTASGFLRKNREAIAPWARIYEALWYGVPSAITGVAEGPEEPHYASANSSFGWVALFVVALGYTAMSLGRHKSRLGPERATLLLFILGTTLYVVLVSNCLEVGENNRFRAEIEPFALVLMAYVGSSWWQRRRA